MISTACAQQSAAQ